MRKYLLILLFVVLFIRMVKLSDDTEHKLGQLDTVFALRVRLFFWLCKICLGIDMVIVSGLRSTAAQAKLHAQDARNAPAGGSSHEKGLAVDVNGYKAGKIYLLKGSSVALWQPVVQLAQLCGLRWGGNFKGYPDNNHFDAL